MLARVAFLSISIDPENDTPERLKSFAKTNGADLASWSFVVGTPEATHSLSSRLSVFDPRTPSPGPGDHGTALYLFDDRGQLRQRYAGAPLDGQRLRRELLQLDALCRGAAASPTRRRQHERGIRCRHDALTLVHNSTSVTSVTAGHPPRAGDNAAAHKNRRSVC